MKFNLKNRPKEIEIMRFDWWFVGFEKELREIHDNMPDVPLKEEWVQQLIGQQKLIKEILGE